MPRTAHPPRTPPQESERQLLLDLEAQHGPLLSGPPLYRALGLPSAAAFRQAASRGQLPVPIFAIPNRRGRFALTRDVAAWLARLRATAAS